MKDLGRAGGSSQYGASRISKNWRELWGTFRVAPLVAGICAVLLEQAASDLSSGAGGIVCRRRRVRMLLTWVHHLPCRGCPQ